MPLKTNTLRRAVTVLSTVSILAILFSSQAFAQTAGQHWVATWAASPQARAGGPPRGGAPAANGTPAANGVAVIPTTPPPNPAQAASFSDQTIRMVVPVSIGGSRVRAEFSNAYGTQALTIGAANVAIHAKSGVILPASVRQLKFGGKPSFSIPPGAVAVSDPVDLAVAKLSELAVTVYLPQDTGPLTMHSTGLHTTYFLFGDVTGIPSFGEVQTSHSWYFLSSVDVLAPASAELIVAFGDSITDGATSTVDANASWPSRLAARLQANPATAKFAVVNQGISGNRVLRDGAATNALARFDRDVIAQPGVKWVMILEGINDIGQGDGPSGTPQTAVTAEDLIGGMQQLIERAHIHGIKVIGCTLTPYQGARYYSDKGEEVRQAYNQWIRTGRAFDAVVDFDKVTQDPANPKQIRPTYNIMDHLHPNDAGYKAMADSVSLSIFAPGRR